MSIEVKLPSQPLDLEKDVISQLESSDPRKIVFFDESITGYVVLTAEGETRPPPKRVSLAMTILPSEVVDTHDPLHYLESVDQRHKFSIVDLVLDNIVYSGKGSSNKQYYVWSFEIPVKYPRKRLNDPRLFLSCMLIEGDQNEEKSNNSSYTEADTLHDYSTSSIDKILPIKLSESLCDIEISHTTTDFDITIENESDNTYIYKPENSIRGYISVPVSISLVIKLKSTKPAGRNDILLTTFTIESSDELLKFWNEDEDDHYFNLVDVNLQFKSGSIDPIIGNDLMPPTRFKYRDTISLAYKLTNNEPLAENVHSSKPVHIFLMLQVQKRHNGEFYNISNTIHTEWTPYLDFGLIASPINSTLKSVSSSLQTYLQPNAPLNTSIRKPTLLQSMYKGPNLNNSSANIAMTNTISNKNPQHQLQKSRTFSSGSIMVSLSTNANSTLSGLKLSFIGKLNIKLGEVITWKIQAINHASTRLNLSLLVQNPINFNVIYSNSAPHHKNASTHSVSNNDNKAHNAAIVHDKSNLYSTYNSLKVNNNSGVVILGNDIRIGPLDSNTAFETELQLMGISKGIFNLDGVKIFDINSGDGLDFGKLIEVFVV
ncbi:uncharacterized protein SPAPADRAFT_132432 [Spathaspora passalidarum NRRL Y-27907]|uniref:Trafficking protein particle complex II-specific subunit 65 IgD3 domain-containing protein n=1 Tax=Spathaspora passalidarum (strain NRRL Y-27907 / 11-Y1) TaxID=619300 RepID=G3AGL7_SPAPN|nr:uncharacterized protein SPAPADRAFT_132432 [Spathaspora passalidarum NRRL Y-27907]EGW35356.1 hypothetical protein SPAPADRAFT_132432 [Spathaspora passalidarum NRRL Y-27907]